MSAKSSKGTSFQQIIRLMSFMKNRIWLYLGSIFGMAVVFAFSLNLVMSYKSKILFDAAAIGNSTLVKSTTIEIIILVLIPCALCPLFSYGIFYCIQKTIAEIRVLIFKHIEELPMRYYDNNHSGEVMSCLNNDLNALENAYFWPIFLTALSIIMGIGSCIIMFYFSWKIAVFTIIMGGITSFVNSRFSRSIRAVSNEIQQHLGAISQRFVDLLSGFHIVKMFGIGKILGKGFDNKNKELANSSVKYAKINATLELSNSLLGNVSFIGVFILGAILIVYYRLSVGTAIACTQLFGGISFMFGQLGGFVSQMQRSLAGASRVFDLLDERTEDEKSSIMSRQSEIMIEFRNVSFSYNDEKRVLDGISFSVPKGKTAAIVGTSGSGKSTVLKLLLGFYTQEAGSIYVNGESVSNLSLEQLRNLTAYVPQDGYLFHGTIEDNIKMGNEKAAKEEIIQAAKAANAHDFIMELPQGYDSLVGEQGTRLSGGQRQRIAIARALIKDVPILLLDEATSALDSESEQHVQDALDKLMKKRTVIVIAHRLSTIEHADVILVLENGKIVEQGNHKELISSRGTYNNLYELQFS